MSTDVDVAKQPKGSSKKYAISENQLGVWKLFVAKERSQGVWAEIRETIPLIIRVFVDVYKVSPKLLFLLLFSNCWTGVELAVDMRIGNMFLAQMENADKANSYTTLVALGCKALHLITDTFVKWSRDRVIPAQYRLLQQHFMLKILKDRLAADLHTSTDTSEVEMTTVSVLTAFSQIFRILQFFMGISSQLLLLKRVSRMKGGRMLFGAFFLQTIITKYTSLALWQLPYFAFISNDAYKRQRALTQFTTRSFRQDIISNGLGNWIVDEYKKASAALGSTSTESVGCLYSRVSPLLRIMEDVLSSCPSVYFAVMASKHPENFSIASIATLQTLGRELSFSVVMFFMDLQGIREALDTLREVYAPRIPSVMKDGTYRLMDKEHSKGMSMVLRDVSFAYPTGGKKTDALKGINLDIKAGQLVIVVGANGSGKSTLTRILARLYDPSSGEFLVDGRPSTEYLIADLHLATALLSQDSEIYPLTLAENIGLGYPEHSSDLEMIKEAAREGGAAEFIEELENGYETMLQSFDFACHKNLNGDKEHPLNVMLENHKRMDTSDISGGQRQRVIAARTFMRFKSGEVKSVIVDEPSSALDADAELQLFQHLISAREGKTMLFVTHRFGHLTKFADQIICMKDGMIVESGSHGELLSADGEYAKLYKIQAQAFSDSPIESAEI